jgi:hypothetical protein
MKIHKRVLLVFIFSLFICKFVKAEIVVYGERTIPLDMGAFVYILADLKKIHSIFDIIPFEQLKSREAKIIIDGTEMVLAALFPGDTGRFFQITGFGSYPNYLANIALAIHRNWRYIFSGRDIYWYSSTDRLSLSISPDEVYAVGWRRTHVNPVPKEPGAGMPEGFVAFRHRSGESAPLSLWMENNGSAIIRMLNTEGITTNLPIERLFINLYPVETNTYKANLSLQIRSHFLSRNFPMNFTTRESNSVLKMLFFANPPVENGNNLEFESAILSEKDIISIMTIFIRNWR